MLKTAILNVIFLLGFALAASAAEGGLVVDEPALQVSRSGQLESAALPGASYSQLELDGNTASLLVEGSPVIEGDSKRVMGHGIKRISWEPTSDGKLAVQIDFASKPEFYAVNAVPGSDLRPDTQQVIAAFSFPDGERNSYPVMGSHGGSEAITRGDEHGNYDLPEFPEAKYSDALVSLKVRNTDFREVLWLLSEIGGVSIVLDPYWDDEPTGTRRPPGGGGGGSGGDGGSGSGPGFRGAGGFSPPTPREGTGNLTLNFIDVPFDTALELVLMSVGLVKVDIYPE